MENPYHSSDTQTGHLFFGRNNTFDWLQRQLAQAPGEPIILLGAARVGKTAVLHQIKNGRLGHHFIAIYLDLHQLVLSSISTFLYEISTTALKQLNENGHEFPLPHQNSFVAQPFAAFGKQFLQPVTTTLQNTPLLLLCDNLDALILQMQNGILPPDTLDTFIQTCQEHNNIRLIFTLTFPNEAINPENLMFLDHTPHREIGPLSQEAALELIRQPVEYIIVKDVAEYIYRLTEGYPEKIHQICHTLFEHHLENQLHQVTIADVAIISRQQSETAVPPSLPVYDVQTPRARRARLWYAYRPGIILVLLLITLAGIAYINGNNRNKLLGNTPASQQTPQAETAVLPTPT
ncbi:MAG: ATP-binding protein, partial [Chloroflexi bacterium]